jgi:predicted dinucleotide-binding enzyme
MILFFFHVRDGADVIRDEEGTFLASADEARAQVLQSAREICADAIKAGRDLSADAVEIADVEGKRLTFVSFAEALPKRLRAGKG